MVACRTDYDNLVTHVFCEPCIMSVQISTLSPYYDRLLQNSLGFHAQCETVGSPDWSEATVAAYKSIMTTMRSNVGLPAVS